MSFVALDEDHLEHRRVFLERFEARRKVRISKSPARVVIDEKATVHRRVDGL